MSADMTERAVAKALLQPITSIRQGEFMSYITIAAPVRQELVIKRSRFIASLAPVETEEAAKEFVAAVKKEFHDARHNPSAWILTPAGDKRKSSDDGEPGGTAGQPVLSVLAKNGLTGVACVVTRYFGGIKLGAAGLARAYGDAAVLAVNGARRLAVGEYSRLAVTCGYNLYSALESFLRKQELRLAGTAYGAEVTAELLLEPEKLEKVRGELTNLLMGRVSFEDRGMTRLAVPI